MRALLRMFSGAGGGFDPEAYFGADLVGWWDASDNATIVRSGADASEWNSRVFGLGGVANVGGGKPYPQYSATARNDLPGFTFATQARFDISSALGFPQGSEASTIAAVGRPTSSSGILVGWGNIPGATRSLGAQSTFPGIAVGNGSATTFQDTTAAWQNNDRIVIGQAGAGDPSAVAVTTDGGTPQTTSVTPGLTTTTSDPSIGWDNTSSGWVGVVQEFLIVKSAVNTYDRQLLEGYLAWKWALVSHLPNSHPYKYTAP